MINEVSDWTGALFDVGQERMVDAVEGGGALRGIKVQHWQQPGRKLRRNLLVPLVLVRQHLYKIQVLSSVPDLHFEMQTGIYIMQNTMVRGGEEWSAGEKNKN